MKKSIVCLALLWMSGWISISHPQEVMPSSFVPTPETAKLFFATDEWLVWYTTSVVPGTENDRAVKNRLHFYINRNPGEHARFVYEIIEPGGLLPKGVLKNGTLVVTGLSTGKMLLVKPDGSKIVTAGPPRSSQLGRHSVLVSQVSDDGVLMQVDKFDPKGVEPVYFVPWSSRGLDFNRKLLVTDEKGAFIGWVSRQKQKVVTLSRTTLQVFASERRLQRSRAHIRTITQDVDGRE